MLEDPPRRRLRVTAPARGRTRALVAAAVVLVVAGAAVVLSWDGGGEPGSPTLREYPAGQRPPAPPIAGELLGGGHLDLASRRGEVVVVNVWASWCGPCRAETGDLEQVYQSTRHLGVSFLGLNIEDERDLASRFLAGRVSYPSIFDPAFENGLRFRDPPAPVGPPATLVIDRAGDLAVAIYRPVGPVELARAVTRVAAESGASGARGQAAGPSSTAEELPPDG
jgi:thiol-disulfide isomerase/thioredoxin